MKTSRDIKTRLLSHVDATSDSGCWLWTGAIGGVGYGCIRIDGKTRRAHRVSYEQFVGQIPAGMCVCHRCDIRLCVNPSHLFLGTYKDNHQDMHRKKRANIARGERKANAKLTAEQVVAIRSDTRPQKEIAAEYHVSRSRISLIKTRRHWRHV